MAEQDEQVLDKEADEPLESKAEPDVQAQAKRMGWIPPERYKGAAEKFVDADVFLRRGEEVLPIIKQQKAKLEGEVTRLSGEVNRLAGIIEKNQEAMVALEEYHTAETKRKVTAVRKELKAEIVRASEAGDHEALAEATDQLSQLNEKVEETREEEKREEVPPPVKLDPAFVSWAEETGWYGKDRKRTALANAAAVELREQGETAVGREFLDLVTDEVEKVIPSRRQRANPDKTSSSRPASRGNGGGKSYADLPAEAKHACDGFTNQLVGEGRRYKTKTDWQAAYAKNYFEEA